MKIKCPECEYVADIYDSIEQIRKYKESGNPLVHRCTECNEVFDVLDNIDYEPPTGGTGEVDPNKTIIPEISLRDYFAGQALSSLNREDFEGCNYDEDIASQAFTIADAMLKERDK